MGEQSYINRFVWGWMEDSLSQHFGW
jgi:hypothetical protein